MRWLLFYCDGGSCFEKFAYTYIHNTVVHIGQAKAVLSWRGQHKEEADELWTRLSAANCAVSQTLYTLSNHEKVSKIMMIKRSSN